MKINKYENEQEWMEARSGKITGSKLKDIVVKRGTGEKIGFYKLIAERLALPKTNENPMERGHRLEEEAIEKFSEATGLSVDTSLAIWEREDDSNIAISPDGYEGIEVPTWAVEVKCLASERHVEAIVTDTVPKEYAYQKLQYFIVNDALETLYFVLYDPRMSVKALHYFTIRRSDIQDEIDEYLEYQRTKLEKVKEIVNQLSF